MAIFSRRIVQRCIDEIRALNLLQKENLDKLIQNELNSSDPGTSIAFEWEVIILAALSKVSEIEYEKKFIEGGSSPDIFCKLSSGVCFVADITTISDRNAHKENPVNYFFQEVHKFLNKKGVSSQGINIQINGSSVGKYGDEKMEIDLPPKGEIPKFIKDNLAPFAKTVYNNKFESYQISIKDGAITISYQPNDVFSSGGYPSYTSLYSLTRNPIFNRLEEKSKQLKKSGFLGINGIFLCDGSCDALNKSNTGVSEISQDKIINHFFRSNPRISFVITISPEERYSGFHLPVKQEKYNKLIFFSNPNATYPVDNEIFSTLDLMGQYLPRPESMPYNALSYLEKNQNKGLSHYGGYSMQGNTIKIPSRTLVEILAGDLDIKNIDYHNEDFQIFKYFKHRISEGKMIEKIDVEKSSDDDDDWIVIRFGESDAAISPYQ
jgi:hypothetical protein